MDFRTRNASETSRSYRGVYNNITVCCVDCFTGSNLKFKLTEFGTLEIISTVETDKGEYEWSTPTQHRKTSSDDRDNNKKGKKSKGKK